MIEYAEPTADKSSPMEGVEVWRNVGNKFVIFQLHYSANERKRGEEYRSTIRSSMSYRKYLQEYEINWESYQGMVVFGDFVPTMHEGSGLKPELGLPLLMGLDFGLTPAAVIAQMQGDQLVILREFTAVNMGIERFSEGILMKLRNLYPSWTNFRNDWLIYTDPSGFDRKDTDERSCVQILFQTFGLHSRIYPGPVRWEPRKQAIEYFLTRMTRSGPAIVIDKNLCPILWKGFSGGYRYAEGVADHEPEKLRPIKDEHSHPMDALQYICAAMKNLSEKAIHSSNIDGPSYGFGSVNNSRIDSDALPAAMKLSRVERALRPNHGDRIRIGNLDYTE